MGLCETRKTFAALRWAFAPAPSGVRLMVRRQAAQAASKIVTKSSATTSFHLFQKKILAPFRCPTTPYRFPHFRCRGFGSTKPYQLPPSILTIHFCLTTSQNHNPLHNSNPPHQQLYTMSTNNLPTPCFVRPFQLPARKKDQGHAFHFLTFKFFLFLVYVGGVCSTEVLRDTCFFKFMYYIDCKSAC